MFKIVKEGRRLLGRFESGDDLLEVLTALCRRENIRLGTFEIIGAVKNAKLGYFDQQEKKYTGCVELNNKLEITACLGNISIKDGEIFCHAHITLADWEGRAFGGHLMPGTIVFAAEFFIQELLGEELSRSPDEKTGLPLWPDK
jgi:predicted DNA-binding protein with PD1-like motif